MSVYLFTKLFYLLVLLLLMCGTLLCGHVCASGSEAALPAKKEYKILEKGEINTALTSPTVEINDFYSPVIVAANNVFVALARVKSTGGDDNKINVLAKYIVTENKDDWEKTVVGSSSGWKTELMVKENINNGAGASVAKGFFAVAKDKEIYLLLVNCSNKGDSGPSTEASCQFEIDVGFFGSDELKWKKSELSIVTTNNNLKQLKEIELCKDYISGSAFLTHDKRIIFVLNVKTKDNKNITALIRQQSKENNFEVVQLKEVFESCHPYIFQWNKSIIKLTPSCKDNVTVDIKKLIDSGNNWNDINESLSRLTGFLVDKQNFVSVKNEKTEILLFTEHKQAAKKIYLWMTDGTRLKNIGDIAAENDNVVFINFFL